jgi:hypothetical protein
MGERGVAAQKRLIEVARQYGIGMIGPNCQGMINAAERFSLEGNAMGAMLNARMARAGLPAGTPDFIRADDITLVAGDALDDVIKPLIAAYEADPALKTTGVILPGDHSFSWTREALINTVADWAAGCR